MKRGLFYQMVELFLGYLLLEPRHVHWRWPPGIILSGMDVDPSWCCQGPYYLAPGG